MKPGNYIFFAIAVIAGLMIASCGKSKEEQVREFAIDFAEKASNNQIDSLKTVYPGIENADSVALKYIAEGIVIKPSEDGKEYEVFLNPDVTIIVKPAEAGSFVVTESHGLFAYEDKQIKLLKDSKEWDSTLTDARIANLLKETVERRRTFTSPDLDFFDLHGPVKEVAISYTGLNKEDVVNGFADVYAKGVYKFDEQGKWTNPQVYKIERNSKGQITKFILSGEKDHVDDWHFWVVFEWKKNKVSFHSIYPNESTIHYHDNRISLIDVGHCYTQYPMDDKVRFSNFEFDENGNWISCQWKQTISYDTSDDPSVPPIPTKYNKGTMKRKISYY